MRLLLTDHTSVLGGGELCLLDLLAGLPDDVEPLLACPPGPLADRARGLGVPVRPLRGTTASLKLGRQTPGAVADLAAGGLAIARVARAHRSDVVLHNSLRAGLMGSVARRVPGAPPGVVHVHDVLPPGRASEGIKTVLHRGLDGALANSHYTAERFGDPRAVVTDNPVDLVRFDPERVVPADLGPGPLLGVIAQISAWKGQLEAIGALSIVRRHVPGARLVVAGTIKFSAAGSRFDNRAYERELWTTVQRLGLEDAVVFLGDRDDVPELLAALDVLLMPSHEEPFGRIAAEAMAMGTAVVSTTVGGPAEFLQDGVTGRLVAPRQPGALAAATLDLLRDDAGRARIAAAGRDAARARFDRRRYVADTLAVLRDVAA